MSIPSARAVAAARLGDLAARTLAADPATTLVLASMLRAAAYPVGTDRASVAYLGVVESVHDGDSVRVAALIRTGLGPEADEVRVLRRVIRLAGLDTPELSAPEPQAREAARNARDALRALLPPGTVVTVLDEGPEKYGRTLARLTPYGSDECVNDTLLAAGHGRPYAGGAR